MNSIDNLLMAIVNSSSPAVEELVSARDARVLKSLASAVTGNLFITENQSNLILKIFKENQENLSKITTELSTMLSEPRWSKPFRKIEQIRKLKIVADNDNDLVLSIEFTVSSNIRKILTSMSKKIENLNQVVPGKIFYADLTEKNIVTIVDALSPLNFDIDETIKNHYNLIKSWDKTETKNRFLITNISHSNFQTQITADLGISTPIDENIIADRGVRYQYYVEKHRILTENLTTKIAWRANTKMWIDSKNHSLENLISSLIELKRFPVMLVFDDYSNATLVENLKKMSAALENNGIFQNIGIYFRMPNDTVGKPFNEFISEKKYNCQLDENTQVVGVQRGKIPKFFLKNPWRPMSVVSIGADLRHSKTAVYANCSDLVITYSDKQPLRFEMEVEPWE